MRDVLRGYALELLAVAGHDPASSEFKALKPKPITFSKTMSDDELSAEVVRFAGTLAVVPEQAAAFTNLTDECTVFLIEQGVITVADPADASDDLGAPEPVTELDLFAPADDGLDAALSEAPEVPEAPVVEQPDLFGADVPAPLQTTDDKVAALDAEQGTPSLSIPVSAQVPVQEATVVVQNIEAAVLSMVEMLREGRTITITATDVTAAVVGKPVVEMPLTPEPVAESAAAEPASPPAQPKRQRAELVEPSADLVAAAKPYVCRWKKLPDVETAKKAARLVMGIGPVAKEDKKKVKYTSDRDRRLFIIANRIPLAKKYDVNTVNGKPLANAIVRWFAETRVAE